MQEILIEQAHIQWRRNATIRCPNCDTVQSAVVVKYDQGIWPTYVHDCTKCGHVILESEWDEIKEATL